MVEFLNTDGLNEAIPKLIDEAERELVIIVPYIKTSDRMYQSLVNADNRGVETVLVYREEKLSSQEKEKLFDISNLNLLHHPNVHAKCYLNESSLLITSMNMYEYSEKNNREMGILCKQEGFGVNNDLFKDAIKEIREVINGSEMEKQSRETKDEGFIIEILKTKEEKVKELCIKLTKDFVHKAFEPATFFGQLVPKCANYFDKIDIYFTDRIELELNYDKGRLEQLHNRFRKKRDSALIKGFRLYWSKGKPIHLRPRDKSYLRMEHYWESDFKDYRVGIDQLISYLRELEK